MRKLIAFMIVLAMALALVTTVSASSLPISDEEYGRWDFKHDDYEQYIVDSIDRNGCEWPEGTKAISWEIPTGHKSIVRGKKVVLPRDIEIIGNSCFMGRDGITNEVIDFSTLTELKCIGKNAFRDTDVTDADLSNTKVVRIDECAFYLPGVTSVIAPPTLKYIGDSAFGRDCSIGTVKLNEGLEYIGNYAFGAYKGVIVIPSTVKHIGYLAMPNAKIYVHKGSYAEQWCIDNNETYRYVEEPTENKATDDGTHVVHRVGPLNVIGYYTHFVGEYPVVDGSKTLYWRVNSFPGVTIETAYDGVEIYYAPYWIKDGEYAEKAGMADTGVFKGFNDGKVTLADFGVTVQPTHRLSKGWAKGMKWTFDKPMTTAPDEHCLIVEYDGMTYRYRINMNWGVQYERVRNDPNYDKMGNDDRTSAVSGTSKLIVDGKEYMAESYNFFGNNYFRLRDIAMFLTGSGKQFEVTYDNEKRAVNLITGNAYTPVGSELKTGDGKTRKSFAACPSPVYCNGKEVLLRARLIEGTNYIMLRDLGQIIDFEIIWDEAQKCIVINTAKGYK